MEDGKSMECRKVRVQEPDAWVHGGVVNRPSDVVVFLGCPPDAQDPH